MVEYNEEIAKQAYQMCSEKIPNHQWDEAYILEVIQSCCRGDKYFLKHYGAFDNYLSLQGKGYIVCSWCSQLELYELTHEADSDRAYCHDCLDAAPLWSARCWDCDNSGMTSWREIQADGNCPKCGSKHVSIEEVG